VSRAWRRALGAALAVTALGFLGWTIATEWSELRRHDWSVDVPELLASLLGLVAVLVWGVWVWHRVLARLHAHDVRFRDLLRIWFLSSLARYVPGKIWQFVGAAGMARSAGIAGPVLLTSMVVHMGFTLLAAAVVSLALLLPSGLELGSLHVAGLGALAGLSVFVVHPAVLNGVLRLVPDAIHQEVIRWDGRWRDGLALLGLNVVSWIGYGLVFTLFVDALVEVPATAALPLTGANALAFLVGYLVFLAPAGLGAREAALAVLLAPHAPAGVAAVVAVATRLWTIGAELVGAAAVALIRPDPDRPGRHHPGDGAHGERGERGGAEGGGGDRAERGGVG
jgi:hypothetical protein